MNNLELKTTNGTVKVSIVNGYKNNTFPYYYNVYDLKIPVSNIGVIGVADSDDFAIRLESNLNKRLKVAIYLDGVNTVQTYGIKSLNNINEENRSKNSFHAAFLTSENSTLIFFNSFAQLNEKNRQFVFTNKENHGLNENLINDISSTNKIEIYIWEENKIIETYDKFEILGSPFNLSEEVDNIKIGVGKETDNKFNKGKQLENPKFLGKLTFIYLHENKIAHLGKGKSWNTESSMLNPIDYIPLS